VLAQFLLTLLLLNAPSYSRGSVVLNDGRCFTLVISLNELESITFETPGSPSNRLGPIKPSSIDCEVVPTTDAMAHSSESSSFTTAPESIRAGNSRNLSRLSEFVSDMAGGEWKEIPNSEVSAVLLSRKQMELLSAKQGKTGLGRYTWGNSGSRAVITAWNSAAFDGRHWYLFGGGHADYGGNELYRFDFTTLEWDRFTDPEILDRPDFDANDRTARCPVPRKGPGSTHTYGGITFVPTTDSIWLWAANAYCYQSGATGATRGVWEFDIASRTWHYRGPYGVNGRAKAAFDDKTGHIVVFGKSGAKYFDPKSGNTVRSWGSATGSSNFGMAIVDARRRIAYETGWSGVRQLQLDQPVAKVRWLAKGWPKGLNYQSGIALHDESGKLVFWKGDRAVWLLDPTVGTWSKLSNEIGAAPKRAKGRPFGKWIYISELKIFAGLDNPNQGVWLYRLPSQ